jgi:hypothetical protein
MKDLLARFTLGREIGLMIDEHEIAVSLVATTVVGATELAKETASYEPDQLAATVERLVKPMLLKKPLARVRIAIGLPMLRVFFSTRPIQSDNRDASPEVLLHEVLQSPTINIDEMHVDLIKTQPGHRPLASIVSCRKKYLANILAALEACGLQPMRAEPAPCALLRAAVHRHRTPRKAGTVVRVFLGEGRAMAVLTAADTPLLWRCFDLPPGAEEKAIASAIAAITILGKYCGAETERDAVMIHGRPDLGSFADLFAGESSPGPRVIRHPGTGLDNASVAFGLALGCNPGVEAFNLARSLKPRVAFWEVFPLGETIAHVAMLLISLFFLSRHLQGEQVAHHALEAENQKHVWAATLDSARLDREKKELEQKVEAIRSFLATRIIWSDYTHDIGASVAPEVKLVSFFGQAELAITSKKKDAGTKPKKNITLRLSSPIAKGGAIPVEVDRFFMSLRRDPLLLRDFPDVELGDLKWSQPTPNDPPMATFTVVCMPVEGPADKSSKAPAKGEKTKAPAKAVRLKGERTKPILSKKTTSPAGPAREPATQPETRRRIDPPKKEETSGGT